VLCLTRKHGEKILIKTPTEEIILTIVRIQPHRVSLGFEAADNVEIVRTELLKDTTKLPKE